MVLSLSLGVLFSLPSVILFCVFPRLGNKFFLLSVSPFLVALPAFQMKIIGPWPTDTRAPLLLPRAEIVPWRHSRHSPTFTRPQHRERKALPPLLPTFYLIVPLENKIRRPISTGYLLGQLFIRKLLLLYSTEEMINTTLSTKQIPK